MTNFYEVLGKERVTSVCKERLLNENEQKLIAEVLVDSCQKEADGYLANFLILVERLEQSNCATIDNKKVIGVFTIIYAEYEKKIGKL